MAMKLHELIAVLGDTQATAAKLNGEAMRTFSKPEMFTRTIQRIEHFGEEDQKLDIAEEKAMETTVIDKLGYIVAPNTRYFDTYLRKEAANQKAVGDIVVGDTVLVAAVPVTVLLGLETKLAELRKVYEAIPTLAPGGLWKLDPATGKNVYLNAQADVRTRTKKSIRPIVLSPPTEHHPANVQAITEDMPIGKITTQTWSGMVDSATKSELLSRVDTLIRAVKQARQRANGQEAEPRQMGGVLFDFLHAGLGT